MAKVWMYHQTDGDSGYYNIKLFSSIAFAEAYKSKLNDAYGSIDEIEIDEASTMPNKPENVKCPECGGEMVSRANRTSGERFWGCKKYPDCKGTRDSMGLSREERRAAKESENEDGDKSSFERSRENDQYRFRKS